MLCFTYSELILDGLAALLILTAFGWFLYLL